MHGDHVSPRAEALIYSADRAHHVDTVVRPALDAGAVVLTDRYLDSSVAYQGSGRDLGADEVERLNLWAVEGLLPDLTVLVDLDPAVGLTRLKGEPDRVEGAGAAFHARARQTFLDRAAADPGRWLVVDGNRPVDDDRRRCPRAGGRDARRGRRMTVWDDVVGQADAVAVLRAASQDPAAMTHAWLITGPPGSGRSIAARAFAAALQCLRGRLRPLPGVHDDDGRDARRRHGRGHREGDDHDRGGARR